VDSPQPNSQIDKALASSPQQGSCNSLPLQGSCVLVTRPREQAAQLRVRLEELGASVLLQPSIRIDPPADWGAIDRALARLDEFQWLVFSSTNGVEYLLRRLEATGGDPRRLDRLRLAAIGPGTAEELSRWRLKAELMPEEYRAESLAEALTPLASGKRFLLARASRGREVLAEMLTAAGGLVEQVVVYRSTDVEQLEPEVASALAAGQIDWITVTSSSIARWLVARLGETLRRTRLVSISPVTSDVLRQLGHEPAAEAAEYTMEGVVQAILAAEED
jgi:uroporphyrinogen III methyltransferase/synthase